MCAADKDSTWWITDITRWRGRHCYLQSGCVAPRNPIPGAADRSYSVAITDVNAEGLPPNCLIAEGGVGRLVRTTARQVGETMHLLYLLSADAGKPACRVLQSGRGNAESDRFLLRSLSTSRSSSVIRRLCWRIAMHYLDHTTVSRSRCVWWRDDCA